MKEVGKVTQVPFRYPSDELLDAMPHQVDFPRTDETPNTRDMDTNIHKYACRMLCTLAIPQMISGKVLTMDQVRQLYQWGITGQLGDNVLDYQCTVGAGEGKLQQAALDMLGNTTHKITQVACKDLKNGKAVGGLTMYGGIKFDKNRVPGPGNIYFIIVDMGTQSKGNYGGHHFVLFNSVGELIYDPARNTVRGYVEPKRLIWYKVTKKE